MAKDFLAVPAGCKQKLIWRKLQPGSDGARRSRKGPHFQGAVDHRESCNRIRPHASNRATGAFGTGRSQGGGESGSFQQTEGRAFRTQQSIATANDRVFSSCLRDAMAWVFSSVFAVIAHSRAMFLSSSMPRLVSNAMPLSKQVRSVAYRFRA